MIQLWHYWDIACSISINKIFFHCYKKHLKWGGGWGNEESFSDYTVLNGSAMQWYWPLPSKSVFSGKRRKSRSKSFNSLTLEGNPQIGHNTSVDRSTHFLLKKKIERKKFKRWRLKWKHKKNLDPVLPVASISSVDATKVFKTVFWAT